MSIDDESLAPPAPRFVPTLTEVVGPGDAVTPAPTEPVADPRPRAESMLVAAAPTTTVAASPAPLPPGTADRAADILLARLAPQLDHLIAEAIARLVHEQMLGFNARVQKTVVDLVREEVAKAIAQGGFD
jgi:hypothetical protein